MSSEEIHKAARTFLEEQKIPHTIEHEGLITLDEKNISKEQLEELDKILEHE
jgi:hypothetical protein